MRRTAVTVAITNYNAGDHLVRLLPQVRPHGFDQIVVLDDASTDGSPGWLANQPDVTLVRGAENLGPTGNRNRILDVDTGEIILFLDVDMGLDSKDVAAALRREFDRHRSAAVVGPLILSQTGEPSWYNWGYEFSPWLDGFVGALNSVAFAHWHDPAVMATVRSLARGKVGHFEPVESRDVDWVVEQFFAVRADVFRQLGGFDPGFRMYHEGADYCRRAREAGHTVRFTTAITATHLDLGSGTAQQRARDEMASTAYYYRKHHGLSDWSIGELFRRPTG